MSQWGHRWGLTVRQMNAASHRSIGSGLRTWDAEQEQHQRSEIVTEARRESPLRFHPTWPSTPGTATCTWPMGVGYCPGKSGQTALVDGVPELPESDSVGRSAPAPVTACGYRGGTG